MVQDSVVESDVVDAGSRGSAERDDGAAEGRTVAAMATAASISSSGGVAAATAAISAVSVPAETPAETPAFRGAAYFLGKASWTKGYR